MGLKMEQHHLLISFLGGQTEVAKMLGISPQAVNKWAGVIPRGRLAEIALLTGRQVENFSAFDNLLSVWPELATSDN